MNIAEDIKRTFKEGSALTRLIYINLGVFLLVKILGVFFYLAGEPYLLLAWLSVPSDTSALLLKPWTPVTYMFLHSGFLHLLFNILGLYWFGKLFMYHFEGNKLLSVYLLGGMVAAAFYVISYNVFPVFTSVNGLLLGASGSVFAILVAAAYYDPDREIGIPLLGNFKLKYIAAFYVVLSIVQISASNPGGNIAHLGGAFWGWFYIYRLRRGSDMGSGLIVFLNKLLKYIQQNLFHSRAKMKVTHRQPPRDDYEYNRQKQEQQEEINRILDKIARSGYDSLTKNEKEILFKQGKK